jgi:hypothetical protein
MLNQQSSNPTTCPSFEGCKAPICPKDLSFENSIWYPDEPICSSLKFRKDHWRISQRKIYKLNFIHSTKGFFTKSTLNQIHIVRKGIKGRIEK